MEGYKGYKKTNLKTYEYGKTRVVYQKDGKLYFRFRNFWHGTFREYCFETQET